VGPERSGQLDGVSNVYRRRPSGEGEEGPGSPVELVPKRDDLREARGRALQAADEQREAKPGISPRAGAGSKQYAGTRRPAFFARRTQARGAGGSEPLTSLVLLMPITMKD